MKSQEIRDKFVNYFTSKKHKHVPSSSLIPHNDNTLLFANAGMNQFKNYFTGLESPAFKRAVSIQKCVRAGGKHNDLENVGHTARHHTFFEMLGNFSFGDYFKNDAIKFAWEFLTQELKIPKDRLYATVHHSDDEAYQIWNTIIGLPADRIFKKGDKDNFWAMGDYGPCGPCSEIFYDHGENFQTPNFSPKDGQDLLDDEKQYVEIWNLVFMQFENTPEGTKKLPNPSIDTGAGLERIAAVLQGKYWNYDSDIFLPIIAQIEKLSGKKYQDGKSTPSIRVVADHIRSATMLITDGVIPSNEGRGYVLRRIIRRAIRHLRELEAPPVSFYRLVPTALKTLGMAYPENLANQALASEILKNEEEKFLETLEMGLRFINNAIENDIVGDTLSGESAFKLYDTYGFPIDLTEVILREKNLRVDTVKFDELMQRRRLESQKSWKGQFNLDDKVFFEIKEKHGTTKFCGYNTHSLSATLLAIVPMGEFHGLIFDQTPFYGESGGQTGDQGELLTTTNQPILTFIDTQKPVEGLILHITANQIDSLSTGQNYTLTINSQKRNFTARNHSATHLLQRALITVLGDHVKQSGSSVGPDKFRFDFTHIRAMTSTEMEDVEKIVNQEIQNRLPVQVQLMNKKEATQCGALAFFGEKYGEEVRVVKMGNFSSELCGGTHVENTYDIGHFSIVSESSLSTGIRRIEGLTSSTSTDRLMSRSRILEQIEINMKVKEEQVLPRIEKLYSELKVAHKEINSLKEKIDALKSDDLFKNKKNLPHNFYLTTGQLPENANLRKLSDHYLDKNPNGILLLYFEQDQRVSFLIRTAKHNAKIDCQQIMQCGLPIIDGKGGGRKDMVQGSGEHKNFPAFIRHVENQLINQLDN